MANLKGGSYDPDPGDSIRLHKKDDSGRVSHKIRSVEVEDDGKRWIVVSHNPLVSLYTALVTMCIEVLPLFDFDNILIPICVGTFYGLITGIIPFPF